MEQYSAGHPGRVSVVTPVHNGRRYLPAMLQSVLGQSWDEVEMIVVADGSEDGPAELARGFSSGRTATTCWSRIPSAAGWSFCGRTPPTSASAP